MSSSNRAKVKVTTVNNIQMLSPSGACLVAYVVWAGGPCVSSSGQLSTSQKPLSHLVLIGILVVMIWEEAKAWMGFSILFFFVLRALGQGWQTFLFLSSFPNFLYENLKGSIISTLYHSTYILVYSSYSELK